MLVVPRPTCSCKVPLAVRDVFALVESQLQLVPCRQSGICTSENET